MKALVNITLFFLLVTHGYCESVESEAVIPVVKKLFFDAASTLNAAFTDPDEVDRRDQAKRAIVALGENADEAVATLLIRALEGKRNDSPEKSGMMSRPDLMLEVIRQNGSLKEKLLAPFMDWLDQDLSRSQPDMELDVRMVYYVVEWGEPKDVQRVATLISGLDQDFAGGRGKPLLLSILNRERTQLGAMDGQSLTFYALCQLKLDGERHMEAACERNAPGYFMRRFGKNPKSLTGTPVRDALSEIDLTPHAIPLPATPITGTESGRNAPRVTPASAENRGKQSPRLLKGLICAVVAGGIIVFVYSSLRFRR